MLSLTLFSSAFATCFVTMTEYFVKLFKYGFVPQTHETSSLRFLLIYTCCQKPRFKTFVSMLCFKSIEGPMNTDPLKSSFYLSQSNGSAPSVNQMNGSLHQNGGVHQNGLSKAQLQKRKIQESFEEAPLVTLFLTYMGYMILNVFGYIRDFMRAVGLEEKKGAKDNNPSVTILAL